MTEKMKEARDNSKVCAAVLTDLSKAFDCLLHDLLIAKLHAFGFDAYLNDRIQVTKVGFLQWNSSNHLRCSTRFHFSPTFI